MLYGTTKSLNSSAVKIHITEKKWPSVGYRAQSNWKSRLGLCLERGIFDIHILKVNQTFHPKWWMPCAGSLSQACNTSTLKAHKQVLKNCFSGATINHLYTCTRKRKNVVLVSFSWDGYPGHYKIIESITLLQIFNVESAGAPRVIKFTFSVVNFMHRKWRTSHYGKCGLDWPIASCFSRGGGRLCTKGDLWQNASLEFLQSPSCSSVVFSLAQMIINAGCICLPGAQMLSNILQVTSHETPFLEKLGSVVELVSSSFSFMLKGNYLLMRILEALRIMCWVITRDWKNGRVAL